MIASELDSEVSRTSSIPVVNIFLFCILLEKKNDVLNNTQDDSCSIGEGCMWFLNSCEPSRPLAVSEREFADARAIEASSSTLWVAASGWLLV